MKRENQALSAVALIPLLAFVSACNDTPTVTANALVEGGPALSRDGNSEVEEIEVVDECDPASFNAAIGPGTCVGDGDVTFGEFLEQLNPVDGGHEDWVFDDDEADIDEGVTIRAVNEGGEFHTFTEVAEFGGGCIPELNGPLGLSPVPECAPLTEVAPGVFVPTAFLTTGVDPGGTLDVTGLSVGTHKFICLIHPWMVTEVTVEADD